MKTALTIGAISGAVVGVWGILQVVLGSMTRIEHSAWQSLQTGFFVTMLAACFAAGWLAARKSGRRFDGAWAGLTSGAIATGAFVLTLLFLSFFLAEAMVQYPFEHEDYMRRGAGSVRGFLNADGMWHEVVGLNLLLWAAITPIQATIGALGGTFWIWFSRSRALG